MASSATSSAPVVLVTGSSDGGIGASLCQAFAAHGCRVFATSRKLESMNGLAESGMEILQLDVTDDASITAAVAHVIQTAGKIDVLVNNAGMPCVGPAMEVSIPRVRKVFETNVFGLLALTQAVTPHMAKQRSGTIVNIGSVAGLLPLPFGGLYSATKAAVHALSHCMRVELKPFGINVVTVLPGAIRSNFGSASVNGLELVPNSMYSSIQEQIEARAMLSQTVKSTPSEAFAEKVVKQVLRKQPPRWMVLGHMAGFIRFLSRLPLWLIDRFGAKKFGLNQPLYLPAP